MEENISILSDYLFSGLSFSTFKFDECAFMACKCYLTRFTFFRKKYYRIISKYIKDNDEEDEFRKVKYYINQVIKALRNSSILISTDKKEIKLYKKIKRKEEILISSGFKIDDLPHDAKLKPSCLIVSNNKERMKYSELINHYRSMSFISLEDLGNEDYIYDQIKVKLLQDESEIYFVGESIYANYIVDSICSVNKIAIHL